ncbi:MAG: sigma-70 family RNA polymerase sigma factor [Gemmatales bacterium]
MSTWGPVLRRLQRQEPFETASDAELLQQFLQAQSSSAFEAIVRRHGSLVLRICQRELTVLADAEDAFQATFLVLARKARSIRQEASLAPWLAGVARRLARRLAQQLRRRRERLAQMHQPSRSSMSASSPSWWDDERRLLPQEYQTVIDLCLIQGLTRDEAAQRLGQSPAAVHGLLYRARLKLKKQLIQRGTVVGASLTGAKLSASVIDRLAPLLSETAVSMLKQGTLTGSLITPAVAALVTSRGISSWLIPTILASGLFMGGLSWWAVSQSNHPAPLVASRAFGSFTDSRAGHARSDD